MLSKELKKMAMHGAMALMSLSQLGSANQEASRATMNELRLRANPMCSLLDRRSQGIEFSFADNTPQRNIVVYVSGYGSYGILVVAPARINRITNFRVPVGHFINQEDRIIGFRQGETYQLEAYSVDNGTVKKLHPNYASPVPESANSVARAEVAINCQTAAFLPHP